MNKKTKALALLILAVFSGICIMEKLDKRPFRFEDFKTTGELKKFFGEKYIVGSDSNIILTDLALSKAKCNKLSIHVKEKENYKTIFRCEYNTGLFSTNPFVDYVVVMYVGFSNEIMKLEFNKGYVGL